MAGNRILGLALFAALYMALGSSALAAEEPAASPYRPTVSNPAALSEPGWIELEFGLQRVHGGENKRRDGLPFLVKYAFDPNWGILLGGDLHARATPYDQSAISGYGDTTLTLKHHHALSDDLALGIGRGSSRLPLKPVWAAVRLYGEWHCQRRSG